MPRPDPQQQNSSPLGVWGWIAIAAMCAALASALWYCVHAWNRLSGVGISSTGWLFLVCGVVVTVAVGAGLMGLLFYSSRKGRDF